MRRHRHRPPSPRRTRGQSEAIAEKAKANAATMLRGKWLPIRESEDEDSPIVGYVNRRPASSGRWESTGPALEASLGSSRPVLPAPGEIAEQVTAAREGSGEAGRSLLPRSNQPNLLAQPPPFGSDRARQAKSCIGLRSRQRRRRLHLFSGPRTGARQCAASTRRGSGHRSSGRGRAD